MPWPVQGIPALTVVRAGQRLTGGGGVGWMRHGIYLPNQCAFAEVAVLVEFARAAETAGWDGFFVWDELLPLHAQMRSGPRSATPTMWPTRWWR